MKTRFRIVFLAVSLSLVILIFTLRQQDPSNIQLSDYSLPDFSAGVTKRIQAWQRRLNPINNNEYITGLWASGSEKEKPLLVEDETMRKPVIQEDEGAKKKLEHVIVSFSEQTRKPVMAEEEKEKKKLEHVITSLTSPVVMPKEVPIKKPVKDPNLPDKVVVMGRLHSDDTSWVERELPDWQHAIYVVDPHNATTPLPPNTLLTSLNKGREAMPYLTYIIDHYTFLPSIMAFIHPHRDGYPIAWHTDAPAHSNVYTLQNLQLDYIKKAGYANLRCSLEPGCPAEVRPFTPESTKEPERHMASVWPALFPDRTDDIPEIIGAACCAQFAVSAEQVLARPLEDYIRIRNWIQETPLDDYTSGRVLEYTWHIIFGKGPVDCPSARDCYCNVYGRRCRSNMQYNGGLRPVPPAERPKWGPPAAGSVPGEPAVPLRRPGEPIPVPPRGPPGGAAGLEELSGVEARVGMLDRLEMIDVERPMEQEGGGGRVVIDGGKTYVVPDGAHVDFKEQDPALWMSGPGFEK